MKKGRGRAVKGDPVLYTLFHLNSIVSFLKRTLNISEASQWQTSVKYKAGGIFLLFLNVRLIPPLNYV